MVRSFAKQMRFDENVDYYRRLGVKTSATQTEIKKRFYELAKKHHPDAANSKPSDEEKFKQITDAYDVLSNQDVKKQYDAARNSTRQQQTYTRSSGGGGGGQYRGSGGHPGGFQRDYQAHESGSRQYNRDYGSFYSHGGQTQQSFNDWKKTQKNDGNYNFFFNDTRNDWTDDRRGEHFSRRGQSFQKPNDGQKRYGDIYGQFRQGGPGGMGGMGGPPQVPHMRFGYFLFAFCMLNIFYGVMTGRGTGRSFHSKSDQVQVQPMGGGMSQKQLEMNMKQHNDPLLSMYHNKASGTQQSMVQGSNVLSSTFMQPQYRTTVPGRARIQEEHQDAQIFANRQQSGDFVHAMVKEELEMRRAGQQPSKEFMEEKKRLQREQRQSNEQKRAEYEERQKNQLYREQDKYLENIAEINKINAQLGMPQIRTEVKYAKASIETGVPTLQTGLPLVEEEPAPPKKKRGSKKKKTTAPKSLPEENFEAAEAQSVAQSQPNGVVRSNSINYGNRLGYSLQPSRVELARQEPQRLSQSPFVSNKEGQMKEEIYRRQINYRNSAGYPQHETRQEAAQP